MKKIRIHIGCFVLYLLVITMIIHGSLAHAADKKTIGVIMIPNIQYYEDIHKAFSKHLQSDKLVKIIVGGPAEFGPDKSEPGVGKKQ